MLKIYDFYRHSVINLFSFRTNIGFIFTNRFYVKHNITVAGSIILVGVRAIIRVRGVIILLGLLVALLGLELLVHVLLRSLRI